MLPQKILELKEKFISMATLVEKMIKKSIEGLTERKQDKLTEVLNEDEPIVNKLELEIDEMCVDTIALFHPEATDLRTVLMVLEMTKDLERIGDLAVNMAESSLFLIERPELKPYIDLPRMCDMTINMLSDSITAFTEQNEELAKDIIARDKMVNDIGMQIFRELLTYMMQDHKTIERALEILRIARALERIGDHSTNLAEDTVFMIHGKVIKHIKAQEERKKEKK